MEEQQDQPAPEQEKKPEASADDVALSPEHLAQLKIERQTLFMNSVMGLAEANRFDVVELAMALKTILAAHFVEHDKSFYRAFLKSLEQEYKARKQRRHIDALRAQIAAKVAGTEVWSLAPQPAAAPASVQADEGDVTDEIQPGGTVEIQVENTAAALEYMASKAVN